MSNLGRETTITVNGKSIKIGRLELAVLEELFAWIKKQEGDPFDDLERFIDKMPEAERAVLFREAQAKRNEMASLSLQSPIAQKYMKTPEGMGMMAMLLLRGGMPDITPSQAFDIFQQIPEEKLREIMQNAQGKSPVKNGALPATQPSHREMKSGITSGSTSDEG